MEYIELASTDPAWNLAAEQYVFDSLEHDKSYFLLWQNDNSIIIGKNQNTAAEINSEYVREKGIQVVRRLSGGGAVYHDLGNLNYTFITDTDSSSRIDFQRFCVPMVNALRTFGIKAELDGRNDIIVEGKKVSGNAQYSYNGRIMHHGTLLFSSDLTVLNKALSVSPEKIKAKGIPSISARVSNLSNFVPSSIGMDDFRQRILLYFNVCEKLRPRKLTTDDFRAIEEIKKSRYDTWEWNYGNSPSCTFSRSRYIPGCGMVQVYYSMEKGLLTELFFSGDFFGNDTDQLPAFLIGCPCRRDFILSALENVNVDQFIHGLSAQSIAELLDP